MVDLTAKEIFLKYSGHASKCLGQNYIFAGELNRKIVGFAGALDGKRVLEIGPGPGGLTVEILKQNPNSLTLVELDNNWANAWLDLSSTSPNICVEHCDFLKFDLNARNDFDIVISNLPYNVSAHILLKFLKSEIKNERWVFMFQKEMAERIIAKPNSKQYGRLSVLAQAKMDITYALTLSPGCFSPPPKVYSSVLVFSPKSRHSDIDFHALNRLVSIAFNNRRKQVVKSISKEYENCSITDVFSQLGIRHDARAEQISVDKYISMSKI